MSTEERCKLHDMVLDTCGDCRPRVPAPQPPATVAGSRFRAAAARNEPGPWFPASFPGNCSGCGAQIVPGDDLRADGGKGWEGRCCET